MEGVKRIKREKLLIPEMKGCKTKKNHRMRGKNKKRQVVKRNRKGEKKN